MNLEAWIDAQSHKLRAADIRAYLLAMGWQLRQPGRADVWWFEKAATADREPVLLYVRADEHFEAYHEAVVSLVTNLAVLEKRLAGEVLDDILRNGTKLIDKNGMSRLAGSPAPTI